MDVAPIPGTPGLVQTVSLDDEADGRIAQVNIWASCRAMERHIEGPAFTRLSRSPHVRNLESREVAPAVPIAGIDAIKAPLRVGNLLFEGAA